MPNERVMKKRAPALSLGPNSDPDTMCNNFVNLQFLSLRAKYMTSFIFLIMWISSKRDLVVMAMNQKAKSLADLCFGVDFDYVAITTFVVCTYYSAATSVDRFDEAITKI